MFAEFGKVYGPLTYLKAMNKSLLVLNTFEVAQDLLDSGKRGQIYSDRPHLHFAGDIVGKSICFHSVRKDLSESSLGFDEGTAFMSFGPTWRKHRRFLKHALNLTTIKRDYAALQERKAYEYVRSLLENPEDFMQAIKRCVMSVVRVYAPLSYGPK